MRDLDTIEGELRLVVVLRRTARERGGPLDAGTVYDNAARPTRHGQRRTPSPAGRGDLISIIRMRERQSILCARSYPFYRTASGASVIL